MLPRPALPSAIPPALAWLSLPLQVPQQPCGYCSDACLGHLKVIWSWIQQEFAFLHHNKLLAPGDEMRAWVHWEYALHTVTVLTEVLDFALEPVYLHYRSKQQQKGQEGWTLASKRIKDKEIKIQN